MKKTKLTITRDKLIKDIVNDFNKKYSKEEVKEILNNFEWWCNLYLTQATPYRDVQIRPFYGLQLNSRYKPDTMQRTFLSNDTLIPAHIELKPKYTSCHQKRINQIAKENGKTQNTS